MRRWAVASVCVAVIAGVLATAGTGAEKEKKRAKLPAAAKGFAGMIEGKVVSVKKASLVLKVDKVAQVWEANKAKDPQSLIGAEVRVVCRKEADKPAEKQVRYLGTLKAGDTTVLDVANKKGNALTLLELTEEQREKAG
jgi:hypothetical protein